MGFIWSQGNASATLAVSGVPNKLPVESVQVHYHTVNPHGVESSLLCPRWEHEVQD